MRVILSWFFIYLFYTIPAQNVEQAIKLYKNGDYSQSAILWEKELKKPDCNKQQIYFQLGNVYYKSRNYAQALANYEKSLRENYNQEDVHFNIKVVRAKLGLDTENKILFTNDLLRKISYLISDFYLKLSIILLALILLSYGIFRFFKGDNQYAFIRKYLYLICVFLIILLFLQNYYKGETGNAIVSIESLGFENVNLKGESKIIREGETVKIIDEVGDIIQVETESNKDYWIQKSNVIPI